MSSESSLSSKYCFVEKGVSFWWAECYRRIDTSIICGLLFLINIMDQIKIDYGGHISLPWRQ